MDIIKDSLSTIVNQFHYETSFEHFVLPDGMKPPSDEEYKKVAPYFQAYNMTPQDAFSVMMLFDKDPSNLTKKDVELRIKMLNVLLNMMNEPDTSDMILQNYKEMLSSKSIPEYQIENLKGMLNLLKRLVKLLIIEAETSTNGNGNDKRINVLGVAVILIAVLVLAYMLYNKK